MTFQLEQFFVDVFAPQSGDVLTIMYDLPHGEIGDQAAWQERREMAVDWHQKIAACASKYGVKVNPPVVYDATGAHARDLPEFGQSEGQMVRLEDEKAGFHWAYGRSEFLGGAVTPQDFSAPDKVLHQDIVYAKGNPIVCQRLDFIFPDGTHKTAVVNGILDLEN